MFEEYGIEGIDSKGHQWKRIPTGQLQDYTNIQFYNLTFLFRVHRNVKSQPDGYWLAQCSCGKTICVRQDNIQNQKFKSCGCYHAKLNKQNQTFDLTGQRFGLLTALYQVDSNKGAIWKCKCDCGNEVIVHRGNLQSGGKKSCGCLYSWREKEILSLLQENQIEYKQQYTFSDCKFQNKLRFDFAIFNNNILCGLIEYQGVQHYNAIDFFGGEESFELQQVRDKIKQQYCLENHIPLLILNKSNYSKEQILTWINSMKEGSK